MVATAAVGCLSGKADMDWTLSGALYEVRYGDSGPRLDQAIEFLETIAMGNETDLIRDIALTLLHDIKEAG